MQPPNRPVDRHYRCRGLWGPCLQLSPLRLSNRLRPSRLLRRRGRVGQNHQLKRQRNRPSKQGAAQSSCSYSLFSAFSFHFQKSVQRTRRSLFPLNARARPCAKLIPPGVTDAILEPTRYAFHNRSKRSTALHLRFLWNCCITSFAPPLLRIQSHGLS